jgi:hypothetical protein
VTVTRFAVVRDIDALAELVDGLAAWGAARGPAGSPSVPLTGVWIEHPEESALSCRASSRALQDGPARLRLQFGPGRWTICVTEAAVAPATLIAELRAASGVRGATRARFVPVFDGAAAPASRVREWHDLATRFPGLVLPPLVSDDAGRLCFAPPLPVQALTAPGTTS